MRSLGSSNLGLDPAAVAHQASTIHSHAGMLNAIAAEVGRAGEASRAPGLFGLLPGNLVMTAGSILLAQSAEADVRAAAAAATDLLGRLAAAIREQEYTSSATDGYTDGAMSAGAATDLYTRVMVNPGVLNDMTPAQVKSWFDGLTPAQQDDFVTKYPQIAGNTNGIPFDRRIEANVLNAQDDLANGATGDQKDYLEKVVAGEVNLISYSPKDDRIIEMVGEYYPEDVYVDGVLVHPKTQDIINYVPGTTAEMDGFYSGSTQEMTRKLVDDAIPPGSIVGFVYKDSPFPTFNPDGVWNNSWAQTAGDPYHDFNTALGFENTSGVGVTSIEHSFATAVGGRAESRGTVFETRITLGGIGMLEGWEPNKDTTYVSIASDDDAIRLARDKGWGGLGYPTSPTEKNGFIEIDAGFEPAIIKDVIPGGIPIPVPGLPFITVPSPEIIIPNNPIEYVDERLDQHSRVAGVNDENGRPDNQRTIKAIEEILAEN
jgi:hypothetical protein